MRGHEPILAMRRMGHKPPLVWLSTDGYNPGFTRLARMGFPVSDHVELCLDDKPHRLDLRFLVGLVVEVSGSDEHRVAAAARACRDAGAKQVIAAWATVEPWLGDYRCTTHRMTFTNKELNAWPA